MKPKLYLDTSIPSAPFDNTKPMRIHITEGWFRYEAAKFDLYTSTLTLTELQAWTNEEKRHKALEILVEHHVTILNIHQAIEDLAREYIQKGAFPASENDDARHIACATYYKIQNVSSWDFKHIVSINPILKIREIHEKKGLLRLNIGTLALFGGDAYGTFEPEKFVKDKDKIY
jgi:predicted nucleic acid-binding protein